MSGKGGVGKSTVAVNLALSFALQGKKVGLLDVDIHGPSVPKMLKLESYRPEVSGAGKMLPAEIGSLKVVSIGFLLESPDSAVVWRGPMKISAINQFITDVEWGTLDALVVDAPPGTGDEPLTACQLLAGENAEAVIVTTPQQISATDVAKSLTFCRELKLNVAGIVENMSTFVCPCCGKETAIFSSGAGEELAERFGVPLLGKLPIDPIICQGGDEGTPFIRRFAASPTAAAFAKIVEKLS
ncbi:MAG: Mrp/NBP35 family ATP-binding protein [Victivallaceae bacterium]|nr:Mrp/NBP35 family ATP-binding protein [Victivallaceae bacterium]